jgi:hypothetical protein
MRDGYSHLHFLKDRDGDLPVGDRWGLLFDRDNGYRRDPNDHTPRPSVADEVSRALERLGEASARQLVEETGASERAVKDALRSGPFEARTGAHGAKVWRVQA